MAKIMLVDDAVFMRMMLKEILNGAGYSRILETRTSGEAINMLKVERPDVVFLDVTMPDTDGIEALTKMKDYNPDTKVIMCSSMGQEEVVKECFEKGADDFIVKPFKPERIIESVSQFVEPDEQI